MHSLKVRLCVLAAGALVVAVAGPRPAVAADPKLTLSLPTESVAYAWATVAEKEGFWKAQGIDVDTVFLAGFGATQAVLNGDAQFTANTGVSVLPAVAHKQAMIAVASIQDTYTVSIVISKEAAAKSGLTVSQSTPEQRAKALKGLTIGVQAPNSNLDAFVRHAAAMVGLNPNKDMTLVTVPSAASVGAMEAHRIDGFSASSPFPFVAEQDGSGVIWISGSRGDVPDLHPSAGAVISASLDYCSKNADLCRKFVAGVAQATAFIKQNPDKALADIQPAFKTMDPAVLKKSLYELKDTLAPNLGFTDAMWETTQKFIIEGGILKPDEKLSKFDGVAYTNAYLP